MTEKHRGRSHRPRTKPPEAATEGPSIATLQDYLLGKTGEEQSDQIEEVYFTNREVLEKLRSAEIELIGRYLDRRLTPDDHARFEERYLQEGVRKQLVEEVRTARQAPNPRELS